MVRRSVRVCQLVTRYGDEYWQVTNLTLRQYHALYTTW